jgi:hypothetical protein
VSAIRLAVVDHMAAALVIERETGSLEDPRRFAA